MNKTKRSVLLLLACALMLPDIFACCTEKDSVNETEKTQEESIAETTCAESSRDDAFAELEKKDFNGKEFNILLREEYEYEFEASEETGDLINDAVYRRNGAVEDLYNIKIKSIARPWTWGGADTFNNTLVNSIMAGDDSFDLVSAYAAMIFGAVELGLFYNWYDIPYIELSRPWWSSLISDSLTINDRIYAMAGDIVLSLWKNIQLIYFNKTLASDYSVENLYDVVRNGSWTLDEIQKTCTGVSSDIDGDTEFTEKDKYGYITSYTTQIDAFMPAFGIKVVGKDENGKISYVINNQKTIDAIEKIKNFIYDGKNTCLQDIIFSDENMNLGRIFQEDRALYYAGLLNYAEEFRNMETDYGMLPYSKYDESQEQYFSTTQDNFSLVLVPSTVKDIETEGSVIEALCRAGYAQIVPVYMDIVIKYRGGRDEESFEMLDIIRNSPVYDFGYINSFALDLAGHIFVDCIRHQQDFASTYEKKEKSINNRLDKILEAYYDD